MRKNRGCSILHMGYSIWVTWLPLNVGYILRDVHDVTYNFMTIWSNPLWLEWWDALSSKQRTKTRIYSHIIPDSKCMRWLGFFSSFLTLQANNSICSCKIASYYACDGPYCSFQAGQREESLRPSRLIQKWLKLLRDYPSKLHFNSVCMLKLNLEICAGQLQATNYKSIQVYCLK